MVSATWDETAFSKKEKVDGKKREGKNKTEAAGWCVAPAAFICAATWTSAHLLSPRRCHPGAGDALKTRRSRFSFEKAEAESLAKPRPETFQTLVLFYPPVAFFMTFSLANRPTRKSNSGPLLKNF